MEILFLNPVFKEAIWGGKLLKEFGYEQATDKTGECWGISAHKSGDCSLKEKLYHGFMKITENYLETFRITYFHY